MVLNVEVGSGSSNSDTYVATQDVTDYLTKFGSSLLSTWTTLVSGDLAAAEAHCRLASRWIDTTYEHRMKGRKLNSTQALAFPRVGINDYSGYRLQHTPLPQQLLDATSSMVSDSLNGDDLTPSISAGGGSLERDTIKVGPILSTQVFQGSGSTLQKSYVLADSLLEELLIPDGRVVRV